MYYCRSDDFFFFKQKTAYEMRISDWSSDVCSSDLGQRVHIAGGGDEIGIGQPQAMLHRAGDHLLQAIEAHIVGPPRHHPEIERAEIGRASCRERVCQYV